LDFHQLVDAHTGRTIGSGRAAATSRRSKRTETPTHVAVLDVTSKVISTLEVAFRQAVKVAHT
jgi:hypothetical protein